MNEAYPPIESSALLREKGFRHAFFTRQGGVSPPPWKSLSFVTATGDEPTAVLENRRRAARTLGVPVEKLYYMSQVHGTAACLLTGEENWDAMLRTVGDIALSITPGVACGVRSADCVPVLLGEQHSGAVAAIHSGWKGTVAKAVEEGVRVLRAASGQGRNAAIVAAVGPHIERCCFEVGEDVAAQLAACSSAGEAAVIRGGKAGVIRGGETAVIRRGKAHVDLRKVIRAQLETAGIAREAIEDVSGCTVCDAERFHSYRRDGKVSGRLLSAIVARGR